MFVQKYVKTAKNSSKICKNFEKVAGPGKGSPDWPPKGAAKGWSEPPWKGKGAPPPLGSPWSGPESGKPPRLWPPWDGGKPW